MLGMMHPGSPEWHFEIAIVGGGPAGLSAAIWAARYLHSVVVVDSGDPRNWETRGINGYLGLPASRRASCAARPRRVPRRSASSSWTASVDPRRAAVATTISCCASRAANASFRTRLLLAIGLRDVWPDVPGLERVYGANAHVCPDCDGYEAATRKSS